MSTTTSECSSSSSFESTKKNMEATIIQAPKSHKQAKEKVCPTMALLRRSGDPAYSTQATECAHIIPEAAFFGVGPQGDNTEKEYSTTIQAVLEWFRSDISGFNGERLHSLMNVMVTDHNIHEAFNRLELYLEASEELGQNTYKVKTFKPSLRFPSQRDSVTFTTKDAETHPVPSPELLALHATCCKVAHSSGSTEYIDTLYEDSEVLGVLASDGTLDILRYKLLPLVDRMAGSGHE